LLCVKDRPIASCKLNSSSAKPYALIQAERKLFNNSTLEFQTHIFRSGQPNGVGPTAVLEFWVQVLISQQLWHRDQATLYLLDHLCKAAFQYSQEDCIQKLLYQQHKVGGCGMFLWLLD